MTGTQMQKDPAAIAVAPGHGSLNPGKEIEMNKAIDTTAPAEMKATDKQVAWAIRDDGVRTEHCGTGFHSLDHFKEYMGRYAKSYVRDKHPGQPRQIFVLCEAAGMVPQIVRACGDYPVTVKSSGGMDSVTAKYDLARECSYKDSVVLHVGDYDPTGLSIFHQLALDVRQMMEDHCRQEARTVPHYECRRVGAPQPRRLRRDVRRLMVTSKDGYWSGWNDYRNGPRKKVSLPPVMQKEQRKHVVSEVFDLLQDWRKTPFENEGPVRAGIRSGLCLKGEDWHRADHEAASILTAAFQRIGVPRPSWDQGQRQYTIADEDCNWCGIAISDELRGGGRASRFCSTVCASSAIKHREWEGHAHDSSVYRSALSMVNRGGRPDQICAHCERVFKPFGENKKEQKYCSVACKNLGIRTIPECECPTCHTTFKPQVAGRRFCSHECAMARPVEPRKCQCCKQTFTPKNEQGLVCSKSCQMRMHRIRKAAKLGTVYKPLGSTFDGNCQHCREPFLARSPKAIYCSPRCNNLAAKARKRRGEKVIPFVPIHMLTAKVIDGWFARAA